VGRQRLGFASHLRRQIRGGLDLIEAALVIARSPGHKDRLRAVEFLTARMLRATKDIPALEEEHDLERRRGLMSVKQAKSLVEGDSRDGSLSWQQAMGAAMGVAVRRGVGPIVIRRHEVPPREHAYDRPIASGGIDFLPLERVRDRLAGVPRAALCYWMRRPCPSTQ
jgi:hypothetical protein